MTDFQYPVDIANRATQHCGVRRIDRGLGFTEISKNAAETGACYDGLRRAELRAHNWVFAIRRTVVRAIDTNTMLLRPGLWSNTTTYFVGSIVSDQNGVPWESLVPDNLGNDPLNSANTWAQYCGPLTVSLWSPTISYMPGELVYTAPGDGTVRVFRSLVGSNSDNPATATAWDATVTYFKNEVVTSAAIAYMSKIDLNINQTPAASAADWSALTTYAINNLVNGSDGVTYKSLQNGNLNHDPISSPTFWQSQGFQTPWTTNFVGGKGSIKWLQIGGVEFPFGVGLATTKLIYPVALNPAVNEGSRNVFRKPANCLRMSPQDPKAGSSSTVGAPSGLLYKDWNQESNFIVTSEVGPLMLRFVADVVDVRIMDPMFCEMLGARIGLEVCESLTQSTSKKGAIASEYRRFYDLAQTANAIEVGAEELPTDDYLSCRG